MVGIFGIGLGVLGGLVAKDILDDPYVYEEGTTYSHSEHNSQQKETYNSKKHTVKTQFYEHGSLSYFGCYEYGHKVGWHINFLPNGKISEGEFYKMGKGCIDYTNPFDMSGTDTDIVVYRVLLCMTGWLPIAFSIIAMTEGWVLSGLSTLALSIFFPLKTFSASIILTFTNIEKKLRIASAVFHNKDKVLTPKQYDFVFKKLKKYRLY